MSLLLNMLSRLVKFLKNAIFSFLAVLHGFQALGYLTRDQTQALALKALSPNHWTTREIPKNGILEANL